MKRKILTHKVALERLAKVQKEVDSGKMKIKEACLKYNFPVYKYTYWKKLKQESDAIDEEIDKYHTNTLDKSHPDYMDDRKFEVVHDSSSLAIRDRTKLIKELKAKMEEFEDIIRGNEGIVRDLNHKIYELSSENMRLKDKLIGMVLG